MMMFLLLLFLLWCWLAFNLLMHLLNNLFFVVFYDNLLSLCLQLINFRFFFLNNLSLDWGCLRWATSCLFSLFYFGFVNSTNRFLLLARFSLFLFAFWFCRSNWNRFRDNLKSNSLALGNFWLWSNCSNFDSLFLNNLLLKFLFFCLQFSLKFFLFISLFLPLLTLKLLFFSELELFTTKLLAFSCSGFLFTFFVLFLSSLCGVPLILFKTFILFLGFVGL